MSVQNEAPVELIPVSVRPASPPDESAAAVYRLYDRAGALLYIGSTNNPAVRWSKHKGSKQWWPEVAAYALTWWPSRAEAFAQEFQVIRAEQPMYNAQGVFPFGQAQPISPEAQAVIDALDVLEEIDDPRVRAVAYSQVAAEQVRRSGMFRELRRQMVAEYREQGVSYRKIAQQLGVSLSVVQDIERGYTGSGKNRPRVQTKEATMSDTTWG